ncbi:MAG: hypothetical protein HQ572_03640, partial [Candidatus Omnitrophica bacterium]|nr:hypothetical protein [Candidatus Omnitrophota bacterium]
MPYSNCTISFFKNDLQRARRIQGRCPVKNCSSALKKVPYQKWQVPFCPEHGLRIHKSSGFVYYNGSTQADKALATKRNFMFNADYCINNFYKKGNKIESHRLCYESSEDALTFNIFSELLSKKQPLKKLVSAITKKEIRDDIDLYLWGNRIALESRDTQFYGPLKQLHNALEPDIKPFITEPDIMLIIPKKLVICIEAKFGSKNPIAKDKDTKEGEKPKRKRELIKKYCLKNSILDTDPIFDFSNMPDLFYEQLFRNIVFAASMAKLEGAPDWRVVNLRNQHVMNLKQGKAESAPVMRNVRSILRPK